MPFHRRFSRRNRPRRRRRPRRRMRRRSRRIMLDPEVKFDDINPAAIAASFSGSVSLLNGTAEGTGPSERIGLQMLVVSNLLTYSWTIDSTNNAAVVVRCALVLFKQSNLQTLDIADVWTRIGTADAAISPRVMQEALKYKILWTRTHTLNFAKQQVTRSVFKRMRLKTRFMGPGMAADDIFSGSLWFVAISDTMTVGSIPTVNFHSRIRYVG